MLRFLALTFVAVTLAQSFTIKEDEFYISVEHKGKSNYDWWEAATFYQIYPRTFKDSNDDGDGDLQGIISKLNELKNHGITGAWISPIYASPQVDGGYDIADYREIDPIYGSVNDLKQLLDRAHEIGLKIILDFVPNHTSDKHVWFQKSVDREEGYEDYFIWDDGKVLENGTRLPPNNWISIFAGPAWSWNDKRGQWFLHQFTDAQPDLNYRNKKVIDEMKDILTFWMDLGVDGFRVDAAPFMLEDSLLRDEPQSGSGNPPDDYGYLNHMYTFDLDETFDVMYEFRDHIDDYTRSHDNITRVMMIEAYSTLENVVRYYGSEKGRLGAHFSFNFKLITDFNSMSNATDLVRIVKNWIRALPSQFRYNWVFGNHDQHRVATRLGKQNLDGFNMVAAMLEGIQVTYNGEEIGMENGKVTCEQGRDPGAIKDCSRYNQTSRDYERTPYQWDNSKYAGFTSENSKEPWLPVSDNKYEINLKDQKSGKSHYTIYQTLQDIRKKTP